MATRTEKENALQAAIAAIKSTASLDPSSIDRPELGEYFTFKTQVEVFKELLDPVRTLSGRELKGLTHGHLTSIKRACDKINELFTQVMDFNPDVANPQEMRKGILKSIEQDYEGVLDNLILPVALTTIQQTDFTKIEREAQGHVVALTKTLEEALTRIRKIESDAETALQAVRKTAAQAGVASEAIIFQDAAKEEGAKARKWWIGTICAAVVTMAVASGLFLLNFYYQPTDSRFVWQLIFGKLMIMSIFLFLLYWCARNYTAHRHNQIIDQHRANALKTFQSFVEGTADPRIKDALLIQAANAAFAPRATGYEGKDGETPSVMPIVEMAAKAVPRSG